MATHHHIAESLRQENAHVALNASKGGNPVVALCFELPAIAANQAPPKTITFIPAPDSSGRVSGADNRAWIVRNAAAIVARFDRPRAITANHAGFLLAPTGGEAPAYGWMTNPSVAADGSITIDVEWTPRGVAALNGRDYRFFSPEFITDKVTGEVLSIYGGSLTNDPNFPQLALNAEQFQEHTMLKEIAIALGLDPEKVDAAACVVAINAMKSERQVALNAAQTPDQAKWKPAAELEVALNRATTAEAALAALKTEGKEADIIKTVDAAQAEGKVIPATRDLYIAMCRQEGGLDRFKATLPSMPVIGTPNVDPTKKPEVVTNANGLTADEVAICSQMGLTHEQYLKAKAA